MNRMRELQYSVADPWFHRGKRGHQSQRGTYLLFGIVLSENYELEKKWTDGARIPFAIYPPVVFSKNYSLFQKRKHDTFITELQNHVDIRKKLFTQFSDKKFISKKI